MCKWLGQWSALSQLTNHGPHGLSEILYAFASTANNNGSAFAGLSANTDLYNFTSSIAKLVGRFGLVIPVMVIADSMVTKKVTPPLSGTFPTDKTLFLVLLIAIVIIIGR